MIPTLWDGKPISKPGLYSGITLDEYHGAGICDGPSISSSGLRTIFSKSPAHYWDTSPLNLDRNTDEDETEKRHFVLGRAAHHLFCGQPKFRSLFVLRPELAPDGRPWNGNNKSCIKWLAEQRAMSKTVLTAEQMSAIVGMAKAFGRHPLCRAGILNGLVEHSLFWRDQRTGVWLKARPDVIPNDSGDVADLKSTASVMFPDMAKSIGDYGYNQQGALVAEGMRAVLGIEMASFTLVFVESKRPHCVEVVTLKQHSAPGALSDVERGALQNRMALDVFAACLKAKHWPGPGGDQNDARYIEMPAWRQKQIDDKLRMGGLLQ